MRLLERIASIMPAPLSVSILGSSGSEAVEAALKTAVMRTGRNGVLAFRDAYHGLTYGALAVTHRSHFRDAFRQQLFAGVQFATFPSPEHDERAVLGEIDQLIHASESSAHPIGCIIVEPIQGRGGIVVPPDWFLRALRDRCDGELRVLVFDEVYTGLGRSGYWLSAQHWDVLPDIVVIGKALSGALPLSATVGSADVMSGWPASTGEAIHTSTFIGNPIACAAALAQIEEIENRGLLARARILGQRIRARADGWSKRFSTIVSTRGIGLIQGVQMRSADHAMRTVDACLQRGVLLLVEGTNTDVLAITPPAVITEEQLDYALDVIEHCLTSAA